MVNVKDFNEKNKQLLQYPNFNLALRPVPHVVDAPKPVFNCLPDREKMIHSDILQLMMTRRSIVLAKVIVCLSIYLTSLKLT